MLTRKFVQKTIFAGGMAMNARNTPEKAPAKRGQREKKTTRLTAADEDLGTVETKTFDLSFADKIAANYLSEISSNKFHGITQPSISRDEIYHRAEWYFDPNHRPNGPHTIPPSVGLNLLLRNISLSEFYVNLTRASQTYFPAWSSMLFHGVAIPWISGPGAIGIKDCKLFGDIVQSLCLSYSHAGWRVI